jgi:hypothetical protein
MPSRTTLAGRPRHNRGRTYPPEVLSPEEMESLAAAASAQSSTDIRARALTGHDPDRTAAKLPQRQQLDVSWPHSG